MFGFNYQDTASESELLSHFKLALEHLNNKNDGWWDDILPTTQVIYVNIHDSKCDSLLVGNQTIHDVFNQGVNGLIQVSCSATTLGSGAATSFSLTPSAYCRPSHRCAEGKCPFPFFYQVPLT